MPSKNASKVLPGTSRPRPKGQLLGRPDDNQLIEVTLLLRRPPATADQSSAATVLAAGPKRKPLTHDQFAQKFSAARNDAAKVKAFAQEYGFTIVEIHASARTVKVSGRIADFKKVFAVDDLIEMKGAQGRFRHHTQAISVPAELAGILVSVYGLDSQPAARPRISGGHASAPTFTAPQVARLYNFPSGLDGAGQCLGIIALNGTDSNGKPTGGFASADLLANSKRLKLPRPKVTSVSVLGGANLPGPDPGSDQEITLDVEIASSIAPGAELVVYFAPNTTQGFVQALKTAVHDTIHRPSVISLSWGTEEDSAAPALVNGLDDALQDAAHLGVTVCVATGDLGSADLIPPEMDKQAHVDAPGCSPFALACGGTKLTASGPKIVNEAVWNDGARSSDPGATGGGISNLFDKPAYQNGVTMPKSPRGRTGRGVPDLAGCAGPYQVVVRGKEISLHGTSAVAPLFAGLIARINQQRAASGKPLAGFINSLLYQSSAVFRNIAEGNNDLTGTLGVYHAQKEGWDPCTGLGVPDGTSLLQLLTALPAQSKNSPKPRKRLTKQAA